MLHLILSLFLLSSAFAGFRSPAARQCLSNRLAPAIRPNAQQQAQLLAAQRASLSEVMDGAGFSLSSQQQMARVHGQAAVDREYRRFLMQSRPAVYTKHVGADTVDEAIAISSGRAGSSQTRGQAQFMPGLIREHVEARALREMPGVFQPHGGSVFKYVKFDNVVGYDRGRPTQWMRVEVTSSGDFHGHPMGADRVSQNCQGCRQFGQ